MSLAPFSVYDHVSFQSALNTWIQVLKERDNKFSLRWLAKRVGLKSHTFILRVSQGEKPPNDSLVAKLAEFMQLTVDEEIYLHALAGLARARKMQERDFFSEKIHSIRRTSRDKLMDLSEFDSISSWYHLALLEVLALKDFRSDSEWIQQRLIASVTTSQIEEGLSRLKVLGLIEEQDGKLVRTGANDFNTPHNVPSMAIRRFHAQMMDRAKESLDLVSVEQRCFLSRTITFNQSKVGEVAQMMLEFRNRFQNLFQKETGNSVYHLSLQFFPLTKAEIAST
ncbi:MAG: DUF4423 domain-containing protein [Proteobacteria bacterium]|nr:DUF4423 domain-containing protein [Pseudomonadota bacterium]